MAAHTHTSKHPQMQGNGTGKCLYLVRKPWKCPPNWVSAFWHFKGRDSFLRSSTFRWITACCRNNERLLLCPAAQPSPANHCALHKPSLDTLKPAEGTFAPSCLIIYCIIIIILPLLGLQTFIQIVLLSFSTVDASMMSGLSGKHMPPSLPPSLHALLGWSLHASSQRQLHRGAHAHVAEETLQWVALAVGGGGLRRGLQEGHGSHWPAVLVQPHLLHWVRSHVSLVLWVPFRVPGRVRAFINT